MVLPMETLLRGTLSGPEGEGELTLDRLTSRVDLGQTDPIPFFLGQTKLKFFKDRINTHGNLAKLLWFDGEYLTISNT